MGQVDIKQKIILTTIETIEKFGLQEVKIRTIAQEANVNVAAINYHFGSKEQLLTEAFNYIAKDFIFDTLSLTQNENLDLKDIVSDLLHYFVDGCLKYPNVTRAFLYDAFINHNYESILIAELNHSIQSLHQIIEKSYQKSLPFLPERLIVLISSAFFIGIFPDFFHEYSKIDYHNVEQTSLLIEHLTQQFIQSLI